jgi:transposase
MILAEIDSGSDEDSHYETESDSDDGNQISKRQRGTQLTCQEKWFAVATLMGQLDENRMLNRGAMAEISREFKVDHKVISRLWTSYVTQLSKGIRPPNLEVLSLRRSRSKLTEEMEAAIREVIKKKRDLPVRSISLQLAVEHEIFIPKSSLQRYLQELGVDIVNSHVKPSLSKAQKIWRLEFVLGKLDRAAHGARFVYFRKENLTIHVDEKWYYMVRLKKKIRLFPGEDRPYDDTTQHKKHIPKIMFLAAVGVPHTMPNGQWFDGKVGMWAFLENHVAVRTSTNREAGTVELRSFNVGAAEYRKHAAILVVYLTQYAKNSDATATTPSLYNTMAPNHTPARATLNT